MPIDHTGQGYPRLMLIALAFTIVFLLFYMGSQPSAAGLFPPPWDKLAHFVTYATITGLLRIGIASARSWQLVLLVGAIGGLDEWQQRYIPGRSADPGDLLVDVIAAACAVLAWEYHVTRQARSTSPIQADSGCSRRKQ